MLFQLSYVVGRSIRECDILKLNINVILSVIVIFTCLGVMYKDENDHRRTGLEILGRQT